MKNVPFDPSNRPKKYHLGGTYCTSNFAKSDGKMCISALWPHWGVNFVCHLLFHFWFYCSTHPFLSKFPHFLQKVLPAQGGNHDFRPRTAAVCLKMFTFWTPRPSGKPMFWALCSFVSPLYSLGLCFMRFSRPSKICLPLVTCAFLASGAPSDTLNKHYIH